MKLLIKVFIILIVFSFAAQAQFKSSIVWVPADTNVSDSFKIPSSGGLYYFSAIKFLDTLDAGIDSLLFLVADDPSGRWDTLKYDDGGSTKVYIVEIPNIEAGSVVLDFKKIYPWEWWKCVFEDEVSDSVRLKPIFKELR